MLPTQSADIVCRSRSLARPPPAPPPRSPHLCVAGAIRVRIVCERRGGRGEREPAPEERPVGEREPVPEERPVGEREPVLEERPVGEREPAPEEPPMGEREPIPEAKSIESKSIANKS